MLAATDRSRFCSFAMQMLDKTDKLFRCQSAVGQTSAIVTADAAQTCGKVSCRSCQLPDHLPRSCDDVKGASSKESAINEIDEAMTEAGRQRCVTCGTAYVKDGGPSTRVRLSRLTRRRL